MTKRKSEPGLPDTSPVETLAPSQAERPMPSKAERFIKLANRRVPGALKRLTYVRNLANRGSYSFTREQADSIVRVLSDAVMDVARAFEGQKAADNGWQL